MARLTIIVTALGLVGSNAFAPSMNQNVRSTELLATSVAKTKKQIDNLTKDNFSSALTEIEPFLLNEAGATIYKKSMKRIQRQAKVLGIEVPADFAKEAKATEKKRSKQNEFIQAKEAERLEAEAAAEEEKAAEAEASVEEETAVEEEIAEPVEA